jgi:hypothetical protein
MIPILSDGMNTFFFPYEVESGIIYSVSPILKEFAGKSLFILSERIRITTLYVNIYLSP